MTGGGTTGADCDGRAWLYRLLVPLLCGLESKRRDESGACEIEVAANMDCNEGT